MSHLGKHYIGMKLFVDANVAVITLSNPVANTWAREDLVTLRDLVRCVDADPNVYALVTTGEGDKFFSAGADLKQFVEGDKALAREMVRRSGEAFEMLSAFHGVSITAISGYAMGGGLECALACDLRVADEQAQMALPEASVGLLSCGGSTKNLPRLVGEGWVKRMILLGERVDAATSLRIGLVEDVVSKGDGKAHAIEWARQAVKQSLASIAACKRLVQSTRTQTHGDALVSEREAIVDLFDGTDQKGGVSAFLEKRPPRWKNA